MSEEEKKIIDRINRSYDDNTQYVEASAKDWNYIVHSIRKLHEEIEEKTTILLAGSKKVKQLEKEIEELKQNRDEYEEEYIKLLNARYYNCISKDKIIETIEHYNNELEHIKNGEEFENEKPMYYWGKVALEDLLEENKISEEEKKAEDLIG